MISLCSIRFALASGLLRWFFFHAIWTLSRCSITVDSDRVDVCNRHYVLVVISWKILPKRNVFFFFSLNGLNLKFQRWNQLAENRPRVFFRFWCYYCFWIALFSISLTHTRTHINIKTTTKFKKKLISMPSVSLYNNYMYLSAFITLIFFCFTLKWEIK